MIIDLRPKATIALPKDVAKALKLSTGDKFELEVVDGVIKLTPVYVVERKYVKELRQNVNKLKKANPSPEAEGIEKVIDIIEEK